MWWQCIVPVCIYESVLECVIHIYDFSPLAGVKGTLRSIPCLLMPQLLMWPGHQQPWYWLCRMIKLLFYQKDFCYLWYFSVEKWFKIHSTYLYPHSNEVQKVGVLIMFFEKETILPCSELPCVQFCAVVMCIIEVNTMAADALALCVTGALTCGINGRLSARLQ